jgi:murein DD-endopeptidase MepM/ murein hydrolase activator NlpD
METQNVKKDLSNKQQLTVMFVFFILFFAGTLYWMDNRPAFRTVENTSIRTDTQQIALQMEMRGGFDKMYKLIDTMRTNMEHIPQVFPVSKANLSQVSSSFGMRVMNGDTVFHRAIDIRAKIGTPILASASGIVTTARYTSGYGNYTVIDSQNGIEETYGHQDKMFVAMNQEVKQGQIIGTVGNTGESTGPHLDFRIIYYDKNINPALLFKEPRYQTR